MISRDLYALSPAALLDPSIKPAGEIEKLSSADRVFGWVRDDCRDENKKKRGPGAFRGQLRVGTITCEQGPNAIQPLGDEDGRAGRPLAILGQPKPQQARFYVAGNREGEPLAPGLDKSAGYSSEAQALRGRKFYPHQKATTDRKADIWNLAHDPAQALSFNGKDALSAELNGLFRLYGGLLEAGSDHHVLLCTDTWLGEATARLVEDVLRKHGQSAEVLRITDLRTDDLSAFQIAMTELVRWCAQTLPGYQRSGYRISFNLTGGFKSVQGFMQALAIYTPTKVFMCLSRVRSC
jgi:putative CRISPR-associated protein (TIGR02619 family)